MLHTLRATSNRRNTSERSGKIGGTSQQLARPAQQLSQLPCGCARIISSSSLISSSCRVRANADDDDASTGNNRQIHGPSEEPVVEGGGENDRHGQRQILGD